MEDFKNNHLQMMNEGLLNHRDTLFGHDVQIRSLKEQIAELEVDKLVMHRQIEQLSRDRCVLLQQFHQLSMQFEIILRVVCEKTVQENASKKD